jgi:hypothetical protein
MCPLDNPNGPDRVLWLSRTIQFASYIMNGAVGHYNRAADYSDKLSAFKPNDVLLWEADEKRPSYFNDGSSFPDEGISKRHAGKGATVALFGGSVEFMSYAAYYREEAIPFRNRLWCAPDTINGR